MKKYSKKSLYGLNYRKKTKTILKLHHLELIV